VTDASTWRGDDGDRAATDDRENARGSAGVPEQQQHQRATGKPLRTLPFVITLDGPAASGKSTVGLGAARALGLGYFDTGLLYRALTWLALQCNCDRNDGAALGELVGELHVEIDPEGQVFRDGRDITSELRQPSVDGAVSAVSAHAPVREAMRPAQRSLIKPPGLVMAGRDIGTVIVPEAPLKIWLSASVEVRARRRAEQTGASYESVLDEMRRRDEIDGSREVAPMVRAADAVDVDTDGMATDAVIARIVELARSRGA
jgi:cytidylate kinase